MNTINKNYLHEESIEETWELIYPPNEKKLNSAKLQRNRTAGNNCAAVNLEECTEEEFEHLFPKDAPSVEGTSHEKEADVPIKDEVWNPWMLLNPSSAEEKSWRNDLLQNDLPLAVPMYETVTDTPKPLDSGSHGKKGALQNNSKFGLKPIIKKK